MISLQRAYLPFFSASRVISTYDILTPHSSASKDKDIFLQTNTIRKHLTLRTFVSHSTIGNRQIYQHCPACRPPRRRPKLHDAVIWQSSPAAAYHCSIRLHAAPCAQRRWRVERPARRKGLVRSACRQSSRSGMRGCYYDHVRILKPAVEIQGDERSYFVLVLTRFDG